MGQLLTPILLVALAILFVRAFFLLENVGQIIGFVPFFDLGLGWIVPAFAGAIVGYVMDRFVTGYKETVALDKKVS